MIDDAASGAIPNLVVGRTFAKAFGLAGLRVGALVGTVETLAPIRRAILPYTLNAYAAAALPAALGDREYFEWYLAEVRESKTLLYERARARWACGSGRATAISSLAFFGDDLGARDRRRGEPRHQHPRSVRRSRLCGLRPDHRRCGRPHPPADRGARGGAVRRAVINRITTETQIALTLAHRRQGTVRHLDRHPVLRPHAGAGHPPRRLRPEAARDRRPRRRSAPHRRGRRHRARRGRVSRARQPPRHQPRRLLRDADGRDARRRRRST